MKISFHFSEEQLKTLSWEDYEVIEKSQDGQTKLHLLRPFMARFMVDENKAYLPHETAIKQLGKINMVDAADVIKAFTSALRDRAVPKENGNQSPSELTQAVESPDGAAP